MQSAEGGSGRGTGLMYLKLYLKVSINEFQIKFVFIPSIELQLVVVGF